MVFVNVEKDNKEASLIIHNISIWANQIYIEIKEILLLSVKLKSSFTIDIIQWIETASNNLMAVSTSNACTSYDKKELEHNASFLAHTLTWVPIEKEFIQILNSANYVKTLHSIIKNAKIRKCDEIAISLTKYLINWGFKSTYVNSQKGIIKKVICLVAVIH